LFAALVCLTARIRYELVRPTLLNKSSKLVKPTHVLLEGVLQLLFYKPERDKRRVLVSIVFLVNFLNFLEGLQLDFFKILESLVMTDNFTLTLMVKV
jgi:hypothetical protein